MDQDELRSVAPDVERQRHPEPAGLAPVVRHDDPEASVSRLASTIGNRGLSRAITQMRDGEGILPGGLVHPDVEAAIAAASGGGSRLNANVAEHIGGAYGQPLGNVRVHHDDHAAALSRAVSARAFTVGSDIFFGAGEYRPDSTGGRELLAHELAHVVQQRGAPSAGPLMVSQPGDALEREAEAAAGNIG
ncbi:MAG: eCIS core domain-containing protein [Solirubrobacteraceae bacterium]